jgi:hypothetical protein
MTQDSKHKNYEILNLIGYGLAKFDRYFVNAFGFKTKQAFYGYCVQHGIADTDGVLKNRQDLFDPFFDNVRKGWWQKGDAYIHRKITIDSLFGSLDVNAYANIVRLYLHENFGIPIEPSETVPPVLKSRFKQLQVTGYEAESFFMCNYGTISPFSGGSLEDARTFGDGYDFQVEVGRRFYLAEIKGVRSCCGSIRLTQNEFEKARDYKDDYALVVVSNLDETPKMSAIFHPTDRLKFSPKIIECKQTTYHTSSIAWQLRQD